MKREYFLRYLECFIGTPYKLGANATNQGGLDCSALVLEGMRSVGMWGVGDANSQMLYDQFSQGIKKIGDIRKFHPEIPMGAVLFFGESPKSVSHVSVKFNNFQVIEAGGTDKSGMVRVRPITWRKDIIGYYDLFEEVL